MKNKKFKVRQGFSEAPIPEKITFGNSVIEATENNPNFPDAADLLKECRTAVADLAGAKVKKDNAESAAQSATEQQNQKSDSFDEAFVALARQVEDASKGDNAIIKSSGFDSFLAGRGSPVGELPQVVNFSASIGDNEGEFDLNWDRVNGAKSYVIEFSADPFKAGTWEKLAVVTKSAATVSVKEEGIPLGAKVWLRVAAVGAAGQGAFSEPVGKILS